MKEPTGRRRGEDRSGPPVETSVESEEGSMSFCGGLFCHE